MSEQKTPFSQQDKVSTEKKFVRDNTLFSKKEAMELGILPDIKVGDKVFVLGDNGHLEENWTLLSTMPGYFIVHKEGFGGGDKRKISEKDFWLVNFSEVRFALDLLTNDYNKKDAEVIKYRTKINNAEENYPDGDHDELRLYEALKKKVPISRLFDGFYMGDKPIIKEVLGNYLKKALDEVYESEIICYEFSTMDNLTKSELTEAKVALEKAKEKKEKLVKAMTSFEYLIDGKIPKKA